MGAEAKGALCSAMIADSHGVTVDKSEQLGFIKQVVKRNQIRNQACVDQAYQHPAAPRSWKVRSVRVMPEWLLMTLIALPVLLPGAAARPLFKVRSWMQNLRSSCNRSEGEIDRHRRRDQLQQPARPTKTVHA